jgi:hypothetical protein
MKRLKRIRMRNSEGDITRTELYYEVENDASDTNPTLHDLFQLVSSSSPPVLKSPTGTLSAG